MYTIYTSQVTRSIVLKIFQPPVSSSSLMSAFMMISPQYLPANGSKFKKANLTNSTFETSIADYKRSIEQLQLMKLNQQMNKYKVFTRKNIILLKKSFFQVEQSRTFPQYDSQSQSISSLLQGKQFWNICSQDIKYQYIHSGFEYYEWLPSLESIGYYQELITFFFDNLKVLTPDVLQLTNPQQIQQLQKQRYFYLNDSSIDALKEYKLHHENIYPKEIVDKCGLYRVLIDVVIQNLTPVLKDENMLELWTQFLIFMFDLLSDDWLTHDLKSSVHADLKIDRHISNKSKHNVYDKIKRNKFINLSRW